MAEPVDDPELEVFVALPAMQQCGCGCCLQLTKSWLAASLRLSSNLAFNSSALDACGADRRGQFAIEFAGAVERSGKVWQGVTC